MSQTAKQENQISASTEEIVPVETEEKLVHEYNDSYLATYVSLQNVQFAQQTGQRDATSDTKRALRQGKNSADRVLHARAYLASLQNKK
jgi:hypothetical protein